MKGKQLAILLGLVLVVGGLGVLLLNRNLSSWSKTSGTAGGKVLKLPINDVAALHIKTSAGELGLSRKDNGWVVQERADYPASFEKIGDLLQKFWSLKSVQDVKVGPSQMPRLELVEPGGDKSGTLVEFNDKDGKRVSALLLGKKYFKKGDSGFGDSAGSPAGRYVKVVGGPAKVSLVSETFDEVDIKPEQWLKHDFIKVDNVKSVALAGTGEDQHWTLSRESATGEWKLSDAKPDEQIDGGKVVSFGNLLANASFTDVLAPDAKPEETGLDKPSVLTFVTFDGFTYILKVGKATTDSYPMTVEVSADLPKARTPGKDEKPEDKEKLDKEFDTNQRKFEDKLTAEKGYEKRPFLIPKSTLDNYLKKRAELLAEKKPEPAPAPSTSNTPAPGAPPSPAPSAPHVSIGTPPVSVSTPPVTVATPPLQVPGTGQPPANPPAATPPSAIPQPTRTTVVTPPIQVPPIPAPPAPAPGAPANPPAAPPANPPPTAPPTTGEPPAPTPAQPAPAPAPAPVTPPAPAPSAPPATPPAPAPAPAPVPPQSDTPAPPPAAAPAAPAAPPPAAPAAPAPANPPADANPPAEPKPAPAESPAEKPAPSPGPDQK